MLNANYASQAPIKITAISEYNPEDDHYLDFSLSYDLPYTLSASETYDFSIRLLDDVKEDGYKHTFVLVTYEDNQTLEYAVDINEDLLSVTEISRETKIYPNPTTGNFTVEGLNVAQVEVYNLVGQKIYTEQGNVVTIDASKWNKGLYLVAITNTNGVVETKKLVVK